MKVTVLHNNRCGKSRNAISFLDENNIDYEVRLYLENPLTEIEIQEIMEKLNMSIHDIIRKNETLWKEKFSSKNYSHEELISILANHPSLLQRPIVITQNKAFIARTQEDLDKILKNLS